MGGNGQRGVLVVGVIVLGKGDGIAALRPVDHPLQVIPFGGLDGGLAVLVRIDREALVGEEVIAGILPPVVLGEVVGEAAPELLAHVDADGRALGELAV